MSSFWRNWFNLFCLSLILFGVVLCGGAFEATSGAVRLILGFEGGNADFVFTPELRFALAVMGAVSIGWGVNLLAMIPATIALGARGRPFWNAITAGMVSWFVIDSTLSVLTGFGLNVVPNLALAGMYLLGLAGSGALKQRA
ncbi:MAG: hypothetical protein CFE37_03475 [Alphaproteobacteria bacterium PA4]|nr:MAG: hypothetical protein CFE37_03475 [Alphaproteobacteria bacterium PA4]